MKRVLLLLLVITYTAHGQATDSTSTSANLAAPTFKRGFMIELGFSPVLTFLPNIRSFFKDNQIRPNSPLSYYAHFGISLRFDRFKFTGQNGFGLKDNRAFSGSRTSSKAIVENTLATYTSIFAGYDLINARNHRLYLNVGFGGLEYGFNIYQRSTQPIPFQTAFQTAQSGNLPSLLLQNVGYLDINLEYALREKRKTSIESVVRLGYRSGTFAKEYESQAYQLVGAPKDRISQIYLQASFNVSYNSDKWRIQ